MRVQTSLEFIIITASVTAFAVFVLSLYSHFSSQESGILSALPNLTGSSSFSLHHQGTTNVSAFLYLPKTSYINQSSQAFLLLYLPYGFIIQNLTTNSSDLYLLPYSYGSATDYPSIIEMTVIPKSIGINYLNVRILAKNSTDSVNLSTFATTLTSRYGSVGNNAQNLSAYITRRNESIMYGFSGTTAVPNITESQSCTRKNFWGSPLPIRDQCGNALWQVRIFSDQCFNLYATTLTKCFYLSNTTQSMKKINYTYAAIYNISVEIGVNGRSLSTNLSTGLGNSTIWEGDEAVGRSSMYGNVSLYNTNPSQNFVILSRDSKEGQLGITYYQTFMQYLNNAESVLSYYNNSGVSPETLSSINQAISSYNSYITTLGSAQFSTNGCYLNNAENALICRPLQEFLYNIDAELSHSINSVNTTIGVDGSVIRIR